MKNLFDLKLIIAGIVSIMILFACSPKSNNKIDQPSTNKPQQKHIGDSVLEDPLMDKTAQVMRSMEKTNELARRKPKPGTEPPPPPPPPTAQPGCLLIDFDGHLIEGTNWNVFSASFVVGPSGLTLEQQQQIIDTVTSHYSIFPSITVTTSEALFNTYPANKRMRCVVTTDCSWYGCGVGGVTYLNSFTWYDNSPCFVFSSALQYNTKNIEDAVSHEFGHSLGCRHQSSYDENCIKINEYNWGDALTAPIMGASYGAAWPRWWIGPNSLGCTVIQNDTLIISTTLKQ